MKPISEETRARLSASHMGHRPTAETRAKIAATLKGRSTRGKWAGDPAVRFWRQVATAGPDDCWLWTGQHKTGGYGYFTLSHEHPVRAHRWILAQALGRPVATGMQACHHCAIRDCVNPRHLYEGTAKQNTADIPAERREKWGRPPSRIGCMVAGCAGKHSGRGYCKSHLGQIYYRERKAAAA